MSNVQLKYFFFLILIFDQLILNKSFQYFIDRNYVDQGW